MVGSRRRTRGLARSCGGSKSDRAWWGTRSRTRAATASSTWPSTRGSAATGSCSRETSGRMTRRTCGRRRISCRTSPGIRAREGSYGFSPCSPGSRRLRCVPRPRDRPCHAARGARLRGRRRTAGGRTAGLRESLPGRSAVGGGGRAHVRRDELRRLSRWRIRLTRLFYRSTWIPWRAAARALSGRKRDVFLSIFGPLSLILLLALWAVGSVFSFGLLQWAAGSAMRVAGDGGGGAPGFWSDMYMSGTTFFTLGLGDVVPRTALAKTLTVIEAGTGFAFLAAVIGYFPVIYQAFSRREVAISLLDARAGSPPSASELLWRHRGGPGAGALTERLRDWERWAADVLESHLSYPPLAYFRSQHYNESWLAALTTILDPSAVVVIGLDGWCARQAELTFAMARHAVVDLAQVFSTPPERQGERLGSAQLAKLRERLARGGLALRDRPDFERSEEHTSELQSRSDLVCRLLLEKKKKTQTHSTTTQLA